MAKQKDYQRKAGIPELFSEWIRSTSFWTLDFLGGSKVRKHYKDIKCILENNPDATRKKEEYLHRILQYATENVEFYKQYKGFDSIRSFPVINKNVIRSNYEVFYSPEFTGKDFINMQTSGSTGAPFVVRHDRDKRNRVYAEMIFVWGRAGYRIGMKYLFFRISNPFSRLTTWMRNLIVVDDQSHDDVSFERVRKLLRSNGRIRMLLGLPSTLGDLAGYLLKQGDNARIYSINTIICYGEALTNAVRARLKNTFKCSVTSLYSNQECGMMAIECPENKEFHVNDASFFIELLKVDSDDPVSHEEPGRIVVTDLFNRAMPLIRYDTGDTAIWKKNPECSWDTQVFSSIQGQMIDYIYDTVGNKKSPHAISVLMGPFDQLLQYQFIQEGEKQYTLKLNGAEGIYNDMTFRKVFEDYLGKDAEIVIEHVNEIPVLGSGKRKEVVCKYIKPKMR